MSRNTPRTKLDPNRATPASHHDLANVTVYAQRPDSIDQLAVVPFVNATAAAAFVQAIIGRATDDDYEVMPNIGDRECVMTSRGVKISAQGLLAMIAQELTDEERRLLPDNYRVMGRGLRARIVPKVEEEVAVAQERKAAKEAKPKIDRTGKTSIQDIAKELKMEPKEARGILRRLKIEKPAGGWLFDPAAVADIKAKLEANRK